MNRALPLVLLFLGVSLAGLVPAAEGQATPTLLCFDKDPRLAGRCVTDRAPAYLQGSTIGIRIEGAQGAPWVSVRCVGGCPTNDSSATHIYWARYDPANGLRFPQDFPGGTGQDKDGNALADKAPRYNATWETTVHYPTSISRVFQTWLYDATVDENMTVRPGATYYLRSTGFEPGGEVTYRWEYKDPFSGRYAPIRAVIARASTSSQTLGWFEDNFQFPKEEAVRIAECGRATFDCYRIVIAGMGKREEIVNVQVGLAKIERSVDTTPRMAPNDVPEFERTTNVTFDIDLYYPGGKLRTGPKLAPTDVPDHPVFGKGALRVSVEKASRTNESVTLMGQVPLTYSPNRLVWSAQWTIPKDLPIESGVFYRLVLVEQRDVYGNVVAKDTLGNFTVRTAQLRPTVAEYWRELERTEEGVLQLAILYHNGSSFAPADTGTTPVNQSPLRGCYVRIAPPPPPPAPPPPEPQVFSCRPSDPLTWGRYDASSGLWNFSVRYPRGYENLDLHRFILVNGTKDAWDNEIWQVVTQPFRVTPAKPEVEFTTVMRGEDTSVIERGQRVYVSATITYHDGSPFNHYVRPNPNSTEAQVLPGILVRRGPANGARYGPIASEEPFNLTETDASAGRWGAYLQLTDDDTATPIGMWTFKFEIADNVSVPNANNSAFDREVVSAIVVLCPTIQPPDRAATGSVVKFRFKLFYSECNTREVPQGALEGRLSARVYRFDPQRSQTFGNPVSNLIIPTYSRGGTHDWGLEYQVPDELYQGTYALALSGADSYGNKLLPTARSRPFATFTDIITRDVLTQPPREVKRGESATVVFDAREGDTGVDPSRPVPRIQLERFDTSSIDCPTGRVEGGCWARELADVRIFDATLSDHMGVFPVDIDTPVGLYRFSLQGRDSTFHIITAVSGNFTVNPTLVTRALLSTPPEVVVKGERFSFRIENMPGDQVRERVVFYNGRVINVPPPVTNPELGRLNVTWAIPFDAPTGNYTLRLSGRDVNGNVITIITPPIEASAASLEGRMLGQPARVVLRGEETRIQFAVAYPDGGLYAASDTPRVFVVNASGTVAQADVRREGLTFAAFWKPGDTTPIGEYSFEVSPQATGGTGNLFPPLRSQAFRVAPGTVVRNPVMEMGAEIERMANAGYGVPLQANDKFVGFELVYYGPTLSTAISTTEKLPEVTRSPLPHTIDAQNGRYIAQLSTDQSTQIGTFRIEMVGEDGLGNVITSQSRPFLIRPTTVGISWDRFPDSTAFGEGKTITLSFVATYRSGEIFDDTNGRPSAIVLYNNRPVTQRPDVEFVDGRWYMSWTAPTILPDGEYQFTIGGSDLQGNPIATGRSTPYVIQTDVRESFAKSVPGPNPLLIGLALAGAAGLFGALRRKKSA